MSTPKFPVKFKPGDGHCRGTEDAVLILDDLIAEWDDFQKGLGSLSDTEQNAMKEYFDDLFDDHEVGSVLIGSKEDFILCLDDLDGDAKEQLVEKLIETEIYDPTE